MAAPATSSAAAGPATESAVVALQAEVAILRQTLALMLETMETHTEMLQRLMEAAAAPGEAETALSNALADIAVLLTRQSGGLETIQAALLRLPEDIGRSVAAGVREALSDG